MANISSHSLLLFSYFVIEKYKCGLKDRKDKPHHFVWLKWNKIWKWNLSCSCSSLWEWCEWCVALSSDNHSKAKRKKKRVLCHLFRKHVYDDKLQFSSLFWWQPSYLPKAKWKTGILWEHGKKMWIWFIIVPVTPSNTVIPEHAGVKHIFIPFTLTLIISASLLTVKR